MRTLAALALAAALLIPAPSTAFDRPTCGFVPPFAGTPLRQPKERPPSDGHLDSELYPLRVHFRDGYHDKAPIVLEAAEISWEQQVLEWGWEPPAGDDGLGGDDAIDFYLFETEFGGYASADDWWIDDDHARCIGHMVINELMEPDSIRVTVPHEFNHLLQMWTDCLEDPQMFEASAVYAEDWPYPEIDYGWSFAAAYQDGYYRALDYYDYAQPPQYGSFIFLQFLAERFGDGTPRSTVELWQDATQGDYANTNPWTDALERWLPEHWDDALGEPEHGEPYLELAWQEFGEWRWFLGSHAGDEHFQHGHPDAPYGLELPAIGTASRASLEQGPVTIETPHAMAELSAGVVEIRHPGEGWTLSATLAAEDGADRWALSLIGLDDDERVIDRARGLVGAGEASISGEVADDVDTVLLVVAQLGDGDIDPNDEDWGGVLATIVVEADRGAAGDDDDDDDDTAGGDDEIVLIPGDGCHCDAAAGAARPGVGVAAVVFGLAWGLRRRLSRPGRRPAAP